MGAEANGDAGITELLERAAAGHAEASSRLEKAMLSELRRLAKKAMAQESPGHTLQPTVIADDAYLRLIGQRQGVRNASHFRALAGRIIRRLLVDHARAKRCLKRGRGAVRTSLDPEALPGADAEIDLLALHEALDDLAQISPRQAAVVEHRYFGGMTDDEVASHLQVSPRTVQGDWMVARAWLRRRIESTESDG